MAYTVSRDGDIIGQVRAWLAGRRRGTARTHRTPPNAIEETDGFEKLAAALRSTLDLG